MMIWFRGKVFCLVFEKRKGKRNGGRISFVILLPVGRWVGKWVPVFP